MPTAMSRLTGGIGGRGPGETKLEINRRRADERLTKLERDLKKTKEKFVKNNVNGAKENNVPQVLSLDIPMLESQPCSIRLPIPKLSEKINCLPHSILRLDAFDSPWIERSS